MWRAGAVRSAGAGFSWLCAAVFHSYAHAHGMDSVRETMGKAAIYNCFTEFIVSIKRSCIISKFELSMSFA